MKKIVALLSAMMMLSCIIIGCSGQSNTSDKTGKWIKDADLEAKETADELYQAAKEEDVLQIYTVSSRLFDVAESFEKQYPGLVVEVTYLRAEEMEEKLMQNAEKGQYDCDLLFITNGDGCLTEKLIPNGLAYQYIPYDIVDHMREGGSEKYLSVLLEVPLLTYNANSYSEPPISNWWELTQSKWKRQIYITDPSRSMISYTLFSMLEQNSEEMEKAYRAYFGTDYVSENGENAGQTFLRMLIANDLQVVNDSDDVADAIAAPGSDSKAVGILNASKLRLNEQGYTLQVCYEMDPFAGVINPANIMIAGEAPNINSAKLFVRWILGEADGTGEGYQPFLQEGAWPARTDVTGKATKELDDISAIYTDEYYTYEHREQFLNQWNGWLEEYMK